MVERVHGRRRITVAVVLALGLLGACGGGGGGNDGFVEGTDPGTPSDCSVDGHKVWLGRYFDAWYFWYTISPRPDATAYADVASYFNARLYTGTDARYPADRWSRSETDESFNRFFGDGATMGYGVSVAGLEVTGQPDRPLYVRYVEPLSPAAQQGVRRGDRILSLNGRSAAELIAADDFSLLTADTAGQVLNLRLLRDGVERSLSLSAAVFSLSPVSGGQVLASPLGRSVGYIAVKDMISQAITPLNEASAALRSRGVQDLVLDLRYNGGGLVSTGATVASYVSGTRASGLTYASLRYNDRRASANNQDFTFSAPAAALSLPRVLLLTGRRTCSASEQVINGLRGAGIEVVTIGETTCGKPVGFLPRSACGLTYSVVNFESVNRQGQGGYFNGMSASCAVTEDFTVPQGDAHDPLVAAALQYADQGRCPTVGAGQARPMSAARETARWRTEPGERSEMIAR